MSWRRSFRTVIAMSEWTEPGLTVIREPESGNPGTAGVGVRTRPDARPGERVTVEQLWPDGDAEPVYIDQDAVSELIHELMGADLMLQERDSL
jgi:hypothetical protein